jgi:hypothetical protein
MLYQEPYFNSELYRNLLMKMTIRKLVNDFHEMTYCQCLQTVRLRHNEQCYKHTKVQMLQIEVEGWPQQQRVLFLDAYISSQRGTGENRIGALRQYLPKGINLKSLTQANLDRIEFEINNSPLKCLNWRTPYEVMKENRCASYCSQIDRRGGRGKSISWKSFIKYNNEYLPNDVKVCHNLLQYNCKQFCLAPIAGHPYYGF